MKLTRLAAAAGLLVAAGIGGVVAATPASAYPDGVIGSASINSTSFAPGDTATVTVENTTPGGLTMQIFSAPVTIGTGSVGADGTGSVSGAIPAGYSGTHTIQVTGAGGEIYPFTVTISSGGGDNGARGLLEPFQRIATTPEEYVGDNTGAEIAMLPSGRFLYASNRGHDSIAIFAVDAASGRLAHVGWESVQGKKPRFFGLDPDAAHLYACNQDSHTIVEFRVDQESGRLTPTGQVRCREILTAPSGQPVEELRLQAVDRLGLAACSLCQVLFKRYENKIEDYKGVVRSTRPGRLDAAAETGKGVVWWLEEHAEQHGRFLNSGAIKVRRYLCPSCARVLAPARTSA